MIRNAAHKCLLVIGGPVEHRFVPRLRAVRFGPGDGGAIDGENQDGEQGLWIGVDGVVPTAFHLVVHRFLTSQQPTLFVN